MFPYVSRPITITTANRRLRFREGITTGDADLALGTFHIIGDGSANCLLTRFKTAIESATGSTNTYAVRVVFAPLDVDRPIRIQVERLTGSDNYQMLWTDGATTLPGHIFGYSTSPSPTTIQNSDIAPSGVWIGDDMLVVDEADLDGLVFGEDPATSGRYLPGSYSEPFEQRVWGFQRISRVRTWEYTPANPHLSWAAMWKRLRSGGACHLGRVMIQTTAPVTYDAASSASALDPLPGLWVLDMQSRQRVGPTRPNDNAVPTYSWTSTWRKRVTP